SQGEVAGRLRRGRPGNHRGQANRSRMRRLATASIECGAWASVSWSVVTCWNIRSGVTWRPCMRPAFREDRPGEYTPAHSWVAWEHIQLLSRYVLRVPRLP